MERTPCTQHSETESFTSKTIGAVTACSIQRQNKTKLKLLSRVNALERDREVSDTEYKEEGASSKVADGDGKEG